MLRRHEFALALATLVFSVFALGWYMGTATGSPLPTLPCERVYPAQPTFTTVHGFEYPAKPAAGGYGRCLVQRSPSSAHPGGALTRGRS